MVLFAALSITAIFAVRKLGVPAFAWFNERFGEAVAGREVRTIVIGHRGGNFGPDNSMKNFRGAVEHELEGIEFDVSRIACWRPLTFLRVGMDQQRQRANGVARWS